MFEMSQSTNGAASCLRGSQSRPRCSKRRSRLQLILKLFVREFVQQVELAVFIELADARVTHTVEERGLDHRVVDHVFEDDAVADLERFVERVVTELVSGEARVASKFVSVCLFARKGCTDDVRAVRHFEAVRHVCTDGNVQDGDVHFVVDDIANTGDEFACLPTDGFARFHDDLQVRVAFGEVVENVNELVPVVILASDVVTTAKVYPLHLREIFAKVLFECSENNFEGVGILFAECMEMQSFDAVEKFWLEFDFSDAEAGVLAAGIVEVGFDGRVFRVDADACAHAVGECLVFKTLPLRKTVERDVVGCIKNLVDFVFFVDGRKDVDFLVHLFACETCFV